MLFGTDSMYDALSLIQLFKYGCRICHIKLQLTALVTSGCSVLLIVSEGHKLCLEPTSPSLSLLCCTISLQPVCWRDGFGHTAGVMALATLLA